MVTYSPELDIVKSAGRGNKNLSDSNVLLENEIKLHLEELLQIGSGSDVVGSGRGKKSIFCQVNAGLDGLIVISENLSGGWVKNITGISRVVGRAGTDEASVLLILQVLSDGWEINDDRDIELG